MPQRLRIPSAAMATARLTTCRLSASSAVNAPMIASIHSRFAGTSPLIRAKHLGVSAPLFLCSTSSQSSRYHSASSLLPCPHPPTCHICRISQTASAVSLSAESALRCSMPTPLHRTALRLP